MNIILLQSPLKLPKIELLLKEFPHFVFLSLTESACRTLSPQDWKKVEIFFGDRMIPEEFSIAEKLRWIHTPTELLNRLCTVEIEKRGNLIITCTEDDNMCQISEFVLAGILAFTKALFHWKSTNQIPSHVWDSRWRDGMKTLQGGQFLQIGLGNAGTEICRRIQDFEMKIWGVAEKNSFNPYCHKTFSFSELHFLLPSADVVSVTYSKNRSHSYQFGVKEFDQMKEGAIFSFVGPRSLVDDEALASSLNRGKLRGALLDFHYQNPLPPGSPLWKIENALITPEVAPRPKQVDKNAFATFLFNLRQYNHGNYRDMKNRIEL